jgi:hypothetical protein
MAELYSWESETITDVKAKLAEVRNANGDDLAYARFSGAMLSLLPSVLRTIERLTSETSN